MSLIHVNRGDGKHELLTSVQVAEKYPTLHTEMDKPRPYEVEGRELKEIRKGMKITLREMSKRLEISPTELSSMELGHVQPTDKIKLDYKLIEQHGL